MRMQRKRTLSDWGDYNDDGKLDLVSSGEGSDGEREYLSYTKTMRIRKISLLIRQSV